MNFTVFIIIVLVLFGCEQPKKEVVFDFPEIPSLPKKRSMFEANAYQYSTDHAMEVAESQYCACLRKSENMLWEVCENLSDEKFSELIAVQKSEMVKNTMIRSYIETKNRCKLQFRIIEILPDIDK